MPELRDVIPPALDGDERLMWNRAVAVAGDDRRTPVERALAFDVVQLLERVSETRAVLNPPMSPDSVGPLSGEEALHLDRSRPAAIRAARVHRGCRTLRQQHRPTLGGVS